MLIAALIAAGGRSCRKLSGVCALLWSIGLLLAVLPGVFAPGAEVNFAFVEFSNIAGIAAWALAVWQFHCAAPQWTRRMAAAFMIGVIITAINGYYQYFFGFDVMKNFLQSQLEAGIHPPAL